MRLPFALREARPPARLALLLLCALACAAASVPAAAQSFLRGRVVRAEAGVPGARVELHRVTRDSRGVVERATSGAGGAFSVPLPPVDTADGFTVFFATATVDGVRYFGPALHPDQSAEEGYRIAVYDTTSAQSAADSVRVARRDVFLLPEMDGGWEVAEVVRVRNGGGRTLLAEQRPRVGIGLPAGAEAFEAGDGDRADSARAVPGGVVRVGDGVWITEPLLPGERDFFFRYRLPGRLKGTALPLAQATDTLVLYVRQPAPALEVAGLGEGRPFRAEGEEFVRYSAQALRPGARVALDWRPPRASPVDPRLVAVAIAALILAGGVVLAARRRPAG